MMEDRSVQDYSQLVQAKERELHEMHELRCLQLEKVYRLINDVM